MRYFRVLAGALLFSGVFWLALGLVPLPPLIDRKLSSRALFDAQGKLLALSLSPDEKYRLYTPYSEISGAAIKATLLYEDRHFFLHPGVNPYSLLRAGLQTVFAPSRPVGGSTLTMQLARLRFGLKTRNLYGKLKQIFLALVLERRYAKKEILEAYLNLAPYGANVEGIGAASLIYYRKNSDAISAAEAITLAVLPQHPSKRWRATGQASLDAARTRLLSRWIEEFPEKQIVPKDFTHSAAEVPAHAPHFFQRALTLRPEALRIDSTIASELQQDAEDVLKSALKRFGDYGIDNGTILLVELSGLKVRAYVGSASYINSSISGFVNGLAAPRSPGSLLKPFVYGLALDQGRIVPESMLSDVPITLASYQPENFERNFIGPLSATDALVRSRNIPALELFRSLNPSSFYNFLSSSGVKRLLPEEYYGIALVLGGLGVTAEEAAQLFGMLGNAGEFAELSFFRDEKLEQGSDKALSPEASFLVLDMLSKNPPALGRFRNLKIPWKTGTSYGSKDAWAAGIVGNYVLLTWLGNFDGRPNPNLVGRDFAGPLFFSMVDRMVSRGISVAAPSEIGLNLKQIEVCALSGAIPSSDCPHKKRSWFIPGVSPIAQCMLHRRIEIDPFTGLRSCPGTGGESKVFEVWSSSMQNLFRRAGLRRQILPEYDPKCGLSLSSPQEIRIISPEEHLDYFLEEHRDLELQFTSSVPGDAKRLSWFVNDVPVGEVPASEPFYWKAKVGHFAVRAVDDNGRSSLVNIRVLPRVG